MSIFLLLGIGFDVTVGGTAIIDVYHETGRIVSFSSCSGSLCTASFEPACLISVKATATDFRGFIL